MRSPVVSTVTPADLRHTQIGFAFEENVSATTFFGRREKRARPHFSDEAALIHRQLLRFATSGFRQGRMKAAGALIAARLDPIAISLFATVTASAFGERAYII